jgi:hypothetical protein
MKTKVLTKNVTKTNVEYFEGNERSYPYLYPIRDVTQRSLHVRINQRNIYSLTNNEIRIN